MAKRAAAYELTKDADVNDDEEQDIPTFGSNPGRPMKGLPKRLGGRPSSLPKSSEVSPESNGSASLTVPSFGFPPSATQPPKTASFSFPTFTPPPSAPAPAFPSFQPPSTTSTSSALVKQDDPLIDLYSSFRGLNASLLDLIRQEIERDVFVDLSDILSTAVGSYSRHRKEIQSTADSKAHSVKAAPAPAPALPPPSAPAAPPAALPAPPTTGFSFGGKVVSTSSSGASSPVSGTSTPSFPQFKPPTFHAFKPPTTTSDPSTTDTKPTAASPSEPASNPFGARSSAFGSSETATKSDSAKPSPFAAASSAFGGTSAFGSSGSAFGSGTGAFGSSSSKTDKPADDKPKSAFGSSAFGGGGTGAFGGFSSSSSTTAAEAKPASIATPVGFSFGSASAKKDDEPATKPASAFGSSSVFGSSGGASPFGASSAFGTPAAGKSSFGSSAFGGTGAGVFGGGGGSAFGSSSVFGATAKPPVEEEAKPDGEGAGASSTPLSPSISSFGGMTPSTSTFSAIPPTDVDAAAAAGFEFKSTELEGEGEENETTEYSIRGRLVKLVDAKWEKISLGFFKIKKDKTSRKQRVLFRTEGNGHVVANFLVFPGMQLQKQKTILRFPMMDGGTLVSYGLQVKTAELAEEAHDALAKASAES